MITTLGPYTPVSGTVITVKVRTDAQWIYVYNDSPLSLLGKFDGTAPTALSSLDGSYNFAVRPHSDPVVPVQKGGVSAAELQLNGIAQFQGTLYLMPRDPGGLAQSGTVSIRSEIFVTVGGPYDEPPRPSSTMRQTDLSSQPRVITVPIAGGQLQSGNWNMATFAQVAFGLYSYPAALTSPTTLPIYVYSCHLSVEAAPPFAGLTRVACQFEALASDGITVLASGNLLTFTLAVIWNTTSNILSIVPFGYAPPFPPVYLANIPSGTKSVLVQFIKVLGANLTVNWNAGVGFDPNNTNAPGSTGNQTLLNLDAGGPY